MSRLRQNQLEFRSEVIDVTPEFILTQNEDGQTVLAMANQPFGNVAYTLSPAGDISITFSGNSFSSSFRWDHSVNGTFVTDHEAVTVEIIDEQSGEFEIPGVVLGDDDVVYFSGWFCSDSGGGGDVGPGIYMAIKRGQTPEAAPTANVYITRNASNHPVIAVQGKGLSAKYFIKLGSPPSEAEVNGATAQDFPAGENTLIDVDTGITIGTGETAYAAAKVFSETAGGGVASAIARAKFKRPEWEGPEGRISGANSDAITGDVDIFYNGHNVYAAGFMYVVNTSGFLETPDGSEVVVLDGTRFTMGGPDPLYGWYGGKVEDIINLDTDEIAYVTGWFTNEQDGTGQLSEPIQVEVVGADRTPRVSAGLALDPSGQMYITARHQPRDWDDRFASSFRYYVAGSFSHQDYNQEIDINNITPSDPVNLSEGGLSIYVPESPNGIIQALYVWAYRGVDGTGVSSPDSVAPSSSIVRPGNSPGSPKFYNLGITQSEGSVSVRGFILDPTNIGRAGVLKVWSNPGSDDSADPIVDAPDAEITIEFTGVGGGGVVGDWSVGSTLGAHSHSMAMAFYSGFKPPVDDFLSTQAPANKDKTIYIEVQLTNPAGNLGGSTGIVGINTTGQVAGLNPSGRIYRHELTSDGQTIPGEGAVDDYSNLVYNGGMETDADQDGVPDGWDHTYDTTGSGATVTLEGSPAVTGSKSLKVDPANASSGLGVASKRFTVREGDAVRVQATARTETADLDGAGVYVAYFSDTTDFSKTSPELISTDEIIETSSSVLVEDAWVSIGGVSDVPTGATYAVVVLYTWLRDDPLFWDKISVHNDGSSRAAKAINSDPESTIAIGKVLEASIADEAVSTNKIADQAVTGVKVLDLAIDTSKIANSAISAIKIGSGAVTTAKLDAAAVTADKLGEAAVTTVKLALAAVTDDILAASAVTETKIAAGAVVAGKIAAGAVTATEIAAGTITAVEIAAGTITATELATDSVTAVKVLAGAITAAKIDTGAVTAVKIAAGAITTDKLDALAVTADKVAANAITTDKINAGTIIADHIVANNITTEKINDEAVTEGKIGSSAVSTSKIEDNAVTVDKLSVGELSAITADIGEITAGMLHNSGDTAGLNLDATGSTAFLYSPNFIIDGDGSVSMAGDITLNDAYSTISFGTDESGGFQFGAMYVYYIKAVETALSRGAWNIEILSGEFGNTSRLSLIAEDSPDNVYFLIDLDSSSVTFTDLGSSEIEMQTGGGSLHIPSDVVLNSTVYGEFGGDDWGSLVTTHSASPVETTWSLDIEASAAGTAAGMTLFATDASGGSAYWQIDLDTASLKLEYTGSDIEVTGDAWEFNPSITFISSVELAEDFLHSGPNLGVFGTIPTGQITVSGSKEGNEALGNLLTALEDYGLILDSTT